MYETFEKYRESIERLYISENKNFCQPHFHRHVEILYVLESGLLVTVVTYLYGHYPQKGSNGTK